MLCGFWAPPAAKVPRSFALLRMTAVLLRMTVALLWMTSVEGMAMTEGMTVAERMGILR